MHLNYEIGREVYFGFERTRENKRKRKDKAELIRIAKKESKETELSDGLSAAVRDGWKASPGQKVALAFE